MLSKIRENNKVYTRVTKLPRKVWYTEHQYNGSIGELNTLSKPVSIDPVPIPNEDNCITYDEFGNKVTLDYGSAKPCQFNFYRIEWEDIDVTDEDIQEEYEKDKYYGLVESTTRYEYVFTDIIIAYDKDKFDNDVLETRKTIEEEYCVENIDEVLKKVSKEIEDTRNSIIEEYKQGKLSSESYSAYFFEIWNTIMDSIEE